MLAIIQITLFCLLVCHPETKIKINETLIVLILYGYKPWSLRLRKKTLESVQELDAEENICS